MKKRGWMRASALGMAFAVSLSMTAFAGEVVLEERQTETEEQESNGLEMHLYAFEEEKDQTVAEEMESQVIKEITLDQLEMAKEEETESQTGDVYTARGIKELPETAIIVFQAKSFWVQTEEEEQKESQAETASGTNTEIVLPEENLPERTENQKEEEDLPIVVLTEEQKEQVIKTASLIPKTIVVVNGGKLQDESIFKDQKNVKAVFSMNEKTEEDFKESVKKLDLEKAYEEYQKNLKSLEKPATSLLPELPKVTERSATLPTQMESETKKDTPKTSGTDKTPIEKSTTPESNLPDTTAPGNTLQGAGTTTAKKEITLKMLPDSLENGDDTMYVTYTMSCPSDLTIKEGSFSITYDSTKMDLDDEYTSMGDMGDDGNRIGYIGMDESISDAGSTNCYQYRLTKNTGNTKFDFQIIKGNAQVINGDFLDLGFELKKEAKPGDTFNIKVEVLSLKDGNGKELKGDPNVNIKITDEAPITVTSEEETEIETQSQSQTQTQPQPQTVEIQKAAKTADESNFGIWVMCMAVSAGIYVFGKKKGYGAK